MQHIKGFLRLILCVLVGTTMSGALAETAAFSGPGHPGDAAEIPPPSKYTNDTHELGHTWNGGRFYRPVGKAVLASRLQNAGNALKAIPADARVIVYMHGCSGIDDLSGASAMFLASLGYYVVQPDSYARHNKPVSCDPERAAGGFHRGVLPWRHAEATHAIRKLRALPNGQSFKIALQGLSEGGITTATYTGEAVDARVIEGWGCHSRWNEYKGLNAPQEEPVLALVGDYDPWFRAKWLQGDCGAFMKGRRHQNSAVFYPPHELTYQHYLLWHPRVQKLVQRFYAKHLR